MMKSYKLGTRSLAATCLMTMFSLGINAQVDVTSTGGTPTASYPNLSGAFAAVNGGTHQGAITIAITANITETATAVLNASGNGAASYTGITVSPSGGA